MLNEDKIAEYKSKHVTKFRELHQKPTEKIIVWGDGYIRNMGNGDTKMQDGVLIVTDERVAFYRIGVFGELLKIIPLKKITSIVRTITLGQYNIRMHTSHDKLEFKTLQKNKEQEIVNAIEAGRDELACAPEVQLSSQNDPIEAIKNLAELKELGVITEEEFSQKKSLLLGVCRT